jgi:pSer/pThr/pTyr-binding forkhead associated (FHA) protein
VLVRRLIFRHLSGARATEVDVVPLGAHRELILGRAASAAIRFDATIDGGVGRYHARILPHPDRSDQLLLIDLDSVNGTFVNGHRVVGSAVLHGSDRVRLGPTGPEVEIQMEWVVGLRGREVP